MATTRSRSSAEAALSGPTIDQTSRFMRRYRASSAAGGTKGPSP